MRVAHAYKFFKPEVEGEIPEAMDILARGLAARGHENTIVVARRRGRGLIEEEPGLRIDRCPSLGSILSLPVAPTYPLHLRRALKVADVLAVHAPFPLADPIAATLSPSTALVVHWHADIVRQKRTEAMLAPLSRRMLGRADHIIVAHESIFDSTPVLQSYRDKVSFIPYGIDVPRWQLTTSADDVSITRLRRQHPVLYVTVGRLVSYKGFDVLLKAMCLLDGHLVICGEGPERGRLQGLAREMGVEERVTFAGPVTALQMRRYLSAATCFVFPSVTEAETFGIAQLEAMARGVPVVNTALSTAVPHIARHDHEALTVPPGNVDALRRAMRTMAWDHELRQRLSAAARKRAEDHFSNSQFIEGVLRVYELACLRVTRQPLTGKPKMASST